VGEAGSAYRAAMLLQGNRAKPRVRTDPGKSRIKMLRVPGLESPGKRHRCWKTLEKS